MSANWQERGIRLGNTILTEEEARRLVRALIKEVRHISWLMEEILDVEAGVKDVLSEQAQKALVEFAMRTPEGKRCWRGTPNRRHRSCIALCRFLQGWDRFPGVIGDKKAASSPTRFPDLRFQPAIPFLHHR